MLILYIWYGRHSSKCFKNINSFNLQNNTLMLLLYLFLFCRWRDRHRKVKWLPQGCSAVSVEPCPNPSSLAVGSGSLNHLDAASPALGYECQVWDTDKCSEFEGRTHSGWVEERSERALWQWVCIWLPIRATWKVKNVPCTDHIQAN